LKSCKAHIQGEKRKVREMECQLARASTFDMAAKATLNRNTAKWFIMTYRQKLIRKPRRSHISKIILIILY